MNESPTLSPGYTRTLLFAAILVSLLAACSTMERVTSSNYADQPGELVFSPANPLPGERITVNYHAGEKFAGQTALRLRARVRSAGNISYNNGLEATTLTALQRDTGSIFNGEFTLPGEAVYAVFAVEDPAMRYTDSRRGRFWELLIHERHAGGGRRPAPAALEQRFHDHMGRDHAGVLRAAREWVHHYPEHPKAWERLAFAHGLASDETVRRAWTKEYEPRMTELERTLVDSETLDSDSLAWLYRRARARDDSESMERWRARLFENYPGSEAAVALQLESYFGVSAPTADMLEELEALWQAADSIPARRRIAALGPWFARALDNRDARLTWADRRLAVEPWTLEWVAGGLTDTPELFDEGARRLRAEIERLTDMPAQDLPRPLDPDDPDYQQTGPERRLARLQTALARALLSQDHAGEAAELLEAAIRAEWQTERWRMLGEAYIAMDDKAAAANAFAAVAADPATDAETAASLRQRAGVEEDEWSARINLARDVMTQQTRRESVDRQPDPVLLIDQEDAPTELEELLGEAATVVLFWSENCGFSRQAMPDIAVLAANLAEQHVPLLAVTDNSPEQAKSYLQEGGWDITAFFDTHREAARALNNWGTPAFYVLDGAGHLRFSQSTIDDVPRQVLALQTMQGIVH